MVMMIVCQEHGVGVAVQDGGGTMPGVKLWWVDVRPHSASLLSQEDGFAGSPQPIADAFHMAHYIPQPDRCSGVMVWD